MTSGSPFAILSDDLLLTIFEKLSDDPRNWARLSCVCTKFSSIIGNVCVKNECHKTIPSLVADILSSHHSPPRGWAALYKLTVCCPGLHHAGVLLENSDFGLERELGPDENYRKFGSSEVKETSSIPRDAQSEAASCSWSLFDDLYFDTIYNASDSHEDVDAPVTEEKIEKGVFNSGGGSKRVKLNRVFRSHLASGVWSLSREQGNKLLASRFRGDCLYICDWPGCVHVEEKRSYMLFRGVFRNFKQSRVWRTINDGNRSRIDLNCAFCGCKETWDMHSAFCLRRGFGYHEDGEPVVRAYVCENGHVSGAWTDLPLYN